MNLMTQRHAIFFFLIYFAVRIYAAGDSCVTDIDGHIYPTLHAGKFIWMAANLKTRCFNDGDTIPYVNDASAWRCLLTGACCAYNNDIQMADSLGLLYNWYAVNTGKICPSGWRVPSDSDWIDLEGSVDSLYGPRNAEWNRTGLRGYDAGTRLKARTGWHEQGNSSDIIGFSALPGGERLTEFHGLGTSGFWWTSTANNSASAWYRNMVYSFDSIDRRTHPKQMGFSVRCVKDK